jgi:hypothetical protein
LTLPVPCTFSLIASAPAQALFSPLGLRSCFCQPGPLTQDVDLPVLARQLAVVDRRVGAPQRSLCLVEPGESAVSLGQIDLHVVDPRPGAGPAGLADVELII